MLYLEILLVVLVPILWFISCMLFFNELKKNEWVEKFFDATSNYISEEYNNFVDKYSTIGSGSSF